MINNAAKRVLVVDDEVQILHVVSSKLRNGGYEVLTAQDGCEALELAQVERPDLLITDYQMPSLSGLELCQRLKQLPATRQLPAILLTARGFSVCEDASRAAGIKKCLSKPFSSREMLRAVNDMFAVAQV